MSYENIRHPLFIINNREFNWFNGYADIFFNDAKVYECTFHGGNVK